MTWSRPISVWLGPALIVALGLFAILFDGFGLASSLGNRLFDAYQRHAARPSLENTAMPVRVLTLPAWDEDSLVAVVRRLSQQGARLLVLTAPLKDAPSPQGLLARLPAASAETRAALAALPEPGHDLAQALRESKAVVPLMLGTAGRAAPAKARFVYRGTHDPFGFVPAFDSGAAPPALVVENAAGLAAPNLIPDSDGVVRRMAIAFHLGRQLVPGAGVEALRLAEGKPEITVIGDERDPLSFLRGVGVAALETGHGVLPAALDGSLRLHFSAGGAARRLESDADAGRIKDAIIVLGEPGAMARTPFGPASLADITAEGIENLIAGDVLARPSWLSLAEAVLLALLGGGLVLLLRHGLGWAAVLTMAGVALLALGSWYLYAAHGVLLDAATPSVFLGAAFLAGLAAHVHDLRLAHLGLRMAFADSLPRATIERIARRPTLLNIEGENRRITYLVCGVRSQATLVNDYKDNPTGFTEVMQRAMTPLIDQALAHGGTIDRLTADGFAAFWNAPLDDTDHALHACEAANGMAIMSSRITDLLAQEHKHSDDAPLIEIGVGLATGEVVAGAFGGYGRLGYSVTGDCVLLADQIHTLSRRYGPALIVADITKREAERGFAFLEVDTIAGPDNQPVTLYGIMGNPVTRASPKFRALSVFHDHIFQAIRKQQWAMARELIQQCRRLSGASPKLYDLHLSRIAWYENHPPGENWDGAFRQPIA